MQWLAYSHISKRLWVQYPASLYIFGVFLAFYLFAFIKWFIFFLTISLTILTDPSEDIDGWEKQDHPETNRKHRGSGYLYGKDAVAGFLRANRLKMICRAHECMQDGYKWYFKKQLVTVFSAPNYSEGNVAAIMNVRARGSIGFQRFR